MLPAPSLARLKNGCVSLAILDVPTLFRKHGLLTFANGPFLRHALKIIQNDFLHVPPSTIELVGDLFRIPHDYGLLADFFPEQVKIP